MAIVISRSRSTCLIMTLVWSCKRTFAPECSCPLQQPSIFPSLCEAEWGAAPPPPTPSSPPLLLSSPLSDKVSSRSPSSWKSMRSES